jgi:uncharacterized cupin superfamily protein
MPLHWDDVEPEPIDNGDLRGTRWRLGAAAGAVRTGLSRYRLAAGERAMPVHVHGDEEELFYVLAGTGLSWQDGRIYAVGAGDCILHLPGAEAHTIAGAGDGLDVLAFGSGSATGLTWLPRAGAMWVEPRWLPFDGPDPFAAEAAAGPLALPRPEPARPRTIVALADCELSERRRGDVASVRRDLGDVLGSVRIGVGHLVVEPGRLTYPPHCHSAEEELFVVLDGSGTLLLGDERHPVRPGSVVARPPGTGVAHAFRAGDAGMALLAFGTREPNDIAYYPRSGKVSLRGIRAMFRVERVGYWDGEEDPDADPSA